MQDFGGGGRRSASFGVAQLGDGEDVEGLVARADGAAAAGLKQAMGVYRNVCHRQGIQSHAARYAFAREQMQAYRGQGYSEREARAAVSQDLGHGDGRGRYIASVYARGA